MNSPMDAGLRAQVERQSDEMLQEYLQPLLPFLVDHGLSEICINRPGEVWTEAGGHWQQHAIPELTFQHTRQLATLIASYNGKAIRADTPILSAVLPSGERVQLLIPPACAPFTVSLTIRKPSLLSKSLEELQAEGAFAEVADASTELQAVETELLSLKAARQMPAFLDLAVKAQRNILVVGKTGSGKTTVTKTLMQSIPVQERLITIEDVHELDLPLHPNHVHLFYARDDESGARVTAKQALAACLRMKPDRILLAEMRGDESWEFIKSVNTGHPGSISTMHANGAYEAFEQLTALINDSRTGAHLDADYIKRRLIATIDIVLYYQRHQLREVYFDPQLKRATLA